MNRQLLSFVKYLSKNMGNPHFQHPETPKQDSLHQVDFNNNHNKLRLKEVLQLKQYQKMNILYT
jgi:hypothetical protein